MLSYRLFPYMYVLYNNSSWPAVNNHSIINYLYAEWCYHKSLWNCSIKFDHIFRRNTSFNYMRNHFWNHSENKMNNKDKAKKTLKRRIKIEWIKYLIFATYVMQSIIGQTDKQSVHPVQSSVTLGMWVSGSKAIAWYPESAQAM